MTTMLVQIAQGSLLHVPFWAYLDPGTGSIALQLAIAGLLSVLFSFKTMVARFRGFVNRDLARDE